MNKVKQIIIFIIILLIVLTININSYAYAAISLPNMEVSAKQFQDRGQQALISSGIETKKISEEIVPIVQILTTIGILVIGICMVILGIQWVMAKPSPEAQAKLKVKFVSLAVSAGVLFGSYTIWRIIVTIMDNIEG